MAGKIQIQFTILEGRGEHWVAPGRALAALWLHTCVVLAKSAIVYFYTIHTYTDVHCTYTCAFPKWCHDAKQVIRFVIVYLSVTHLVRDSWTDRRLLFDCFDVCEIYNWLRGRGGEEASVDLRCSFVIEILLNISHENERAINHSLLYMICSERSAFTVNLGEQKIYTYILHIYTYTERYFNT